MQAEERRRRLLALLAGEDEPISASRLAQELAVSRQVIVGDVALLRAGGEPILATPRGYCCRPARQAGLVKTLACRHEGSRIGEELFAMVDMGAFVLNVIVEHPLYGQIVGELQLGSRYDVCQFLSRLEECHAVPLSGLTEGVHLHTVLCPDEAAFDRVRAALREKGFLWEPQEAGV